MMVLVTSGIVEQRNPGYSSYDQSPGSSKQWVAVAPGAPAGFSSRCTTLELGESLGRTATYYIRHTA